jgi:hypothetical protein
MTACNRGSNPSLCKSGNALITWSYWDEAA